MSLAFFAVLPLLFSFLTPLFKNFLNGAAILLHLVLFCFLIYFTPMVPLKEFISFNSPLSITFSLNAANLVLAYIFLSASFFITLFYSRGEFCKGRFISSNILLAGVFGLLLSMDIFNIYIFFEIAGISAYILSSLNKDKQGYGAAIRYMVIGSVASIFLLLGIMLIYLNLGSLSLYTIGEGFGVLPYHMQFLILLSLFTGFGIKAEIFPLNFWVADIYQGSSSISASLFSAMVSSTYIFVFFKIIYLLDPAVNIFGAFVFMGVFSFIIAEISALKSKNLKRVFAFSTMGQLGILFLSFSTKNETVISGAVFLIAVHSLAKVLLFLSLHILEKNFEKLTIDIFRDFNSLFLLFVFAAGFLSILGIPPFGGFVAKLTILKGLSSMGAYFIIGAVLIISVVEAVYFFRLLGFNIKGGKGIKPIITFKQKTLLFLISSILLLLGIFPGWFLGICRAGASGILGGINV